MKKLTLVAAGAVLALGATSATQAEITMNAGITSNYLWRGVTQSNDAASVSGGVDWASESGVYVGAWVGSLGDNQSGFNGAESDFYIGYGGEAGSFGYDFGYVLYHYADIEDGDFGEVYGNISVAGFEAGLAYTVNSDADDDAVFGTGDIYASVGYGFDLTEELALAFTLGQYSFDVPDSSASDYMHVQADLTKGDFTFTASKAEEESGDDDLKFVVSWGTSF